MSERFFHDPTLSFVSTLLKFYLQDVVKRLQTVVRSQACHKSNKSSFL